MQYPLPDDSKKKLQLFNRAKFIKKKKELERKINDHLLV